MNVKIVTVLILWIIVIDGYVLKKKTHSKKDNLNCRVKVEEGEKLICTDIVYKSHTDNYDITTIYKTTPENNSGEEDIRNPFITANGLECYDVKIHLRTNAIGMPINFNGFVPNSDRKSLEFIADRKYSTQLNNIFTQNQIEYIPEDWTISTFYMFNEAETPKEFNYNLLLWRANTNAGSFKIKWKQRNSIKMCISISYLLEDESKCTLSVELTDGENLKKKIMNAYSIKESRDLKTLLLKNDYGFNKNQTYSLNFKLLKKIIEKKTYDTKYGFLYEEEYNTELVYAEGCKIGIKRIAQCIDEYENEDILTINEKELQDTPSNASLTVNVYPFDNEPQQNIISPSLECHNGGFAHQNGCVCPPGFKGNNCEYGCGPNKFGADCTGICSIHQTRCRQTMMCTKGFGCKCPAGYSGLRCTKECTSGTYGVNCEQQCPKACLASCNIYTGVCNKGCIASYIAPDCRKKYPWLESPPQLESSDFTSIKLKIDFNSENIRGSWDVNLMFYQIIYKIASNESEFQYLELKEIGEQKSVVETTDNLKPGISYTFGVILVSEDGNYNIEDITTVNYSTNCLLPDSTNYDVNLLSGPDYINVTWNKLNDKNEGYCKITEYLLRLIFKNPPIQQQTYLEEVKSNNNHGYIFENLLSGEKYAVQVTAITATGHAKPSILTYIYIEPNGQIQIKNIKTKFNDNSTLIITWDIDEKYESTSLVYEIKYKVNKHFSCSNKITINNNWTSLLVYNQTRQEISDLIPNTQYVIKVEPTIKGYTYNDYSNMIYVKTPISKPMLKPLMNDENSSYITNQSAYFNWKINMTECSKLNGFFRGYQVILKDIVERTHVNKSIKENTVSYNGLKPDTNYELQIYVMTNHGYNLEQGLLIPFKTKTKFLVPVDKLIVYKKNLEQKSIGIRWSYPNENDISGFIVIAINENLNNTKQIIVEPTERCVAWPTFYCTTFDNLIPNNQYIIKVKAMSQDYPTGGSTSSVVTNFNDGFAGKPENLRTTGVGSTYISLEWGIPYILNGVLKSYIVNIIEISSQQSVLYVEFPIIEELPTYNCTVYDLKPGSTYSIGVLSKTSSLGPTSMIYVTTLQSTIATIVDVDTELPIKSTT